MKTFHRILILALAGSAMTAPAQVYTILHSFGSQSHDGTGPSTDLILNGNTLYGATVSGGTNFNGAIFKINTDGSGYAILQNLTSGPPEGGMVLIGDTLYGTTFTGGSAANGSIYEINTNGSDFTQLYSFSATIPTVLGTNSDGNRPRGGLVTDGTALYGTTEYGGVNGNGTIFKIDASGLEFTVIKTFSASFVGTNNVSGNILQSGTNSDGAQPAGNLILDGTTLYGTTFAGGTSNGVVFSVQTDGSDYTILKYFSTSSGVGTNSDGAAPIAGLTLSGDTLYGVAVRGGAEAGGNIFTLKTNGGSFASLHDFSYNDGVFPRTTLQVDGGTLYGTTAAGGTTNKGTIFMILTNGSDFTVLRNFDNTSGSQCDSKFVVSSNALFGADGSGGSNGGGVVFSVAVLPQIIDDGNFGIRSNAFGFDYTGISNQTAIIEFCTNLAQPEWEPLQTNLLIGSPLYFSDPGFSQNSSAYYRIRSP